MANSEESLIILGDKTGDVYSLTIDPQTLETEEFKLIMGHLSMLTDMVILKIPKIKSLFRKIINFEFLET